MKTRQQIEPIQALGSKKIAGVECRVIRYQERDINGVHYVMDYGIESIVERVTFPKAVTTANKVIELTMRDLASRYPTAHIPPYWK